MRCRTAALLALPLFAVSLAATASALPILIEFKLKDPVGSLENSPSAGSPDALSPGKSEGKGNSQGKPDEKKSGTSNQGGGNSNAGGSYGGNSGSGGISGGSDGQGELKSLTLWLSTDGKAWNKISSDLLLYSTDKITAHINGKVGDETTDLLRSMGVDITGQSKQSYYLGLSTTSGSYAGGNTMTARIESWQFVTKSGNAITDVPPAPAAPATAPEPGTLSLFAAGAVGLAAMFGSRKRR